MRRSRMPRIPPGHLLDYSGKTVLVTGGSRGIGAGIARRFAQAGADVALNYRANEEAAQAVAEQIRRTGRRAVPIQGDVRIRSDVQRMVEEVGGRLGGLDVLINNAGVDPLVPLP